MKTSTKISTLIAGAGLLCAGGVAVASGLFTTLPGIGQGSYCASTVTGVTLPTGQGPYGVVPGSTQGTGMSICGQTVPAGPLTFAGTEYFPVDIGPIGTTSGQQPATALVQLAQLGQGPLVDVTIVAATQTIPNGTAFYVIDQAYASGFTVTMPSAPVEGTMVEVACDITTTGAMTFAGNTGQSIKYTLGAVCTAGNVYKFRYVAANSTWYKV